MACLHKKHLKPWPRYIFGFLLLCQQMMILVTGQNIPELDVGKTITRVVSKDFTNIYVGGVNFIANLSPNLELLENFTIGPVKVARDCEPNPAPCDNNVTLMKIDTAHNMLLVCGSAYRGTCTLHNLLSIYDWYCLLGESNNDGADIVSGDHQHPSVVHFLQSTNIATADSAKTNMPHSNCRTAEFGNGSRNLNYAAQKSTSKLVSNLMVAGSSYNSNFPVNSSLLSLRHITFHGSHYRIGYTKDQNSRPVGLDVPNRSSTSEMPEYKLSFTWGNFSYFLFLQQSTIGCETSSPCIVTKITRTCQYQSSILPHVEIPLYCKTRNFNKTYRLLSTAILGQVFLRQPTDIIVPTLVMAFGKGSDPLSKTVDARYGTAICALNLLMLDWGGFRYLIKKCAKGDANQFARHANWISGQNQGCILETNQNGQCNSNTRNKYIQGVNFFEMDDLTYFTDVSVNFIQAYTHTHTVVTDNISKEVFIDRMNTVFLTSKGKFKKFSLWYDTRENHTRPNKTVTDIYDVKNVSSPTVGITNNTQAIMYVASGQKIMKLDLDICLQFQTCADCWNQNNICQWCPKEKKCRDKDLAIRTCLIGEKRLCPPQLLDFNPKYVPNEGGSNLTLTGSLLGYQGEGVVTVTVCDKPCDHVLAERKKVTCRVRKRCSECSIKCNITISVSGQQESEGNTSSFNLPEQSVLEFVTPIVTSFWPKYGPTSGGTVLTFQGQNLSVGSSINVMIGYRHCTIKPDKNYLICQIAEDDKRTQEWGDIKISIDNFNTTLVNEKFHFRPNPIISGMNPMETIASGGMILTVEGQYLNSVDSPFLTITIPYITTEFTSVCHVHASGYNMTCQTPNVLTVFMGTKSILADVALIMDGKDLVSQIQIPKLQKITVHGDPTVYKTDVHIPEGVTNFLIKGERIPSWIDHCEIIVTVGNVKLDIIAVTSNQIKCNVSEAVAAYCGSHAENTPGVASLSKTGITHTRKSYDSASSHIFNGATNNDDKSTLRKLVKKSTWFSQKLQDLQQFSYQNSQPNTVTSPVSERMNFRVNGSHDPADIFTSTRSYNERSTLIATTTMGNKCNLKIKIGNYEKDLGFVIFEDVSKDVPEHKIADQDSNNLLIIIGTIGAGVLIMIISITSCVMYIRAKRARTRMKREENINLVSTPVLSSTPTVLNSALPILNSTLPVLSSTPPVVNSALPVLNSTLPVLSSTPLVVNSALPVLSSTPPVVNSALPVLSSTPPVVNSAPAVVNRAPPVLRSRSPVWNRMYGSQNGYIERSLPSLKQILNSVIEPETMEDIERLIISFDRLTIGRQIGSGHFGFVFEGHLFMDNEGQAQKVAVKTLKSASLHNIDLNEFVQEAVIMRVFKHPHVLGLIGLTEKEPGVPCVILPYMDNGDLHSFVKNLSMTLTLHDVIKFGADIASGMACLSSLKFVHRDLAARNCMLDFQYRVKIADFGLSRNVYAKGYYRSDNSRNLPVKWMAVESIEHCTYSSKSDVWSFGVLIWELLTRGVTPYPGVDGWDIISYLRSRRLGQPYFCPDALYDLMMQCWDKDPNIRPDFIAIQKTLLGFIGQSLTITDTTQRERNDPIRTCNNLHTQESLHSENITDNAKVNKPESEPNTPNEEVQERVKIIQKELLPKKVGERKRRRGYANVDFTGRNKPAYVNVHFQTKAALDNVLIVIPICHSQKDIRKVKPDACIEIVDNNEETSPKF